MKITAKTTKQELKDFLGANCITVKKQDKNLYERLVYADAMLKKDEKQVTRSDLATLAKEVIKVLGNKVVTPAVAEETPVEVKAENSVKKAEKGVAKNTKKEEEAETKTAKKSLGKKKEPKKDGVKVLNETNNEKALPLANMFPQTIEVEGNTWELASDIENMNDLYQAVENGEEFIFAYYWSKRHLKQFLYFNHILGNPKSFENDLDLCSNIYISGEKKVAYNLSMYTEAVYTLIPEDLIEEDGVRYSCGMEYQIYRAVTKEDEE